MFCGMGAVDIESLGLGNLMEAVKKKLAEIDIEAICGCDEDDPGSEADADSMTRAGGSRA